MIFHMFLSFQISGWQSSRPWARETEFTVGWNRATRRNQIENCRNFWNLWKLFNIIQYYSIVSLGSRKCRRGIRAAAGYARKPCAGNSPPSSSRTKTWSRRSWSSTTSRTPLFRRSFVRTTIFSRAYFLGQVPLGTRPIFFTTSWLSYSLFGWGRWSPVAVCPRS